MRMAKGCGVEGVGVTGRKWRVAVWRGGEEEVVVVAAAAAAARVVGKASRERRRAGGNSIVDALGK